MKKIILYTIIIFLNTSVLFSQSIKIVSKTDLLPVQGLTITSKNNSNFVVTNSKGIVNISAFNKNDSLIFNHISFEERRFLKSELSENYIIYMTGKINKLDEIIFSATPFGEKRKDLPNKIELIDIKNIAFADVMSAGDLLERENSVFQQKSQFGGGSPVIRGFEANKVLIVVDGIRLNNAIYRGGHLQNIITIDPEILDHTEVIFGPGSVIYGSDALGGVMHFFTKNPVFSDNEKIAAPASAMLRYSTACNEFSENVSFNVGFKNLAFLTSISYKNFGDLRAGGNRNPFYEDWGKCNFYTKRIDGKDSMLVNPNPNIQKGTAYHQIDIFEKAIWIANNSLKITLNTQYSNSGDIPRYDRLMQWNSDSGKLNYAEWFYGPQSRLLTSLKAELSGNHKFYDFANIILAYQNISEDRIQRKFGKNNREHREETVNIVSLNLDLRKNATDKNELNYGIEISSNNVGSEAFAENIETGEKTFDISSRYPDNGSTYLSSAAYVSHFWEIGQRFVFSQGIRFNYVNLNCEYSDSMMNIMHFPFDKKIEQKNSAVNGNLGLVFSPNRNWRFSLIASSGYRAPNVDDISKVNDSKSSAHLLIIPNPELKPEYIYNAEFNIGRYFSDLAQLEFSAFYSLLKDAIVMSATTFNGEDSVMYDGNLCQVQANTNAGEAVVYGFQGNIRIRFNEMFSAKSLLTYTKGEITKDHSPLDHIPPVYGITSIVFEQKRFRSEFFVAYHGWKHLEDYKTDGEDNLDQATEFGCPAWYTLNLQLNYQLDKRFGINAALENILDTHYRTFSSGVSAPGRNFVVTLRATL